MMFTCQEQSSSLPFTCNFHYSYYLLRIVVNFFTAIIHIPHCTAQMMDSERAGVLLAAVLIYLRLMQNTFVWLYSTLFRRHRNVMAIRLLTLPSRSTCRFWMSVRNRDWWQRVVFSPNAMLSSPTSFLICVLLQVRVTSFMYVPSTCVLWSERQYCD